MSPGLPLAISAGLLLAVAGLGIRNAAFASLALSRVVVGPCVLEAPASSANALSSLAGHTQGILVQLESDLGIRATAPFRLLLIPPGTLDNPELARLDASAPPWAAGFLLPEIRTGAIRVAQASRYPYGTIEAVFAHETTHMLIHDAVGSRLPRWLEEGVATWEERDWRLEDIVVYSTSLLTTDLPRLADLDAGFSASEGEAQLAYAASFAFVSWSARHYGASFVRDLLREARSRSLADAWRTVTEHSLERSEAAWRRESLLRYRWIPILTASSTLWIGITFLAVVAGVRRRARAREIRKRWSEAEAEET